MGRTQDDGQAIGELGEDFVAWCCKAPFMTDFVFVRPTYRRGTNSKELCDVLILFDDIAIIIQVKAPNPNAHRGWTAQQEIEWANQRVGEAVGQIKGAHAALVKGLVAEVANDRQGTLGLNPAQLRHYYGLAVVHHPPLDRFGKPPVLTCSSSICPVLTATISELKCIFEELSTVGDFADYMVARDRYFSKNAMVGISELDVLAAYKQDPDTFRRQTIEANMFLIMPGVWDTFAAKEQRAARDQANAPSFIVDAIINELHKERSQELDHLKQLAARMGDRLQIGGNYAKVATRLASIRRLDRRNIGLKLIEKSQKCREQKRERYFVSNSLSNADVAFVWLISMESREDRSDSLLALVLAAAARTGATKLTGVVTEPVVNDLRSIDAVMLDLPGPLALSQIPAELRQHITNLFTPPSMPTEYEFPQ